MRHEGDLLRVHLPWGKLVNTINSNYKTRYAARKLALFQIYITIPFYLALGNY